MATWKSPPKAKIYEALSAIGDGRVKLKADRKAEIESSGRSKTYLVEWSDDLHGITSNDNASYWQGYMGYPIIAVLLRLGRLDFNKETADLLSGIPWKQINKQFRNNYDKAVESVLDQLEANGVDRQTITSEVEKIMAQVETLELEKLPSRKPPPR